MIFVANCELWRIRAMKKTGFEQDGPVLTIRQDQGVGGVLFQKSYNSIFIGIVIPDLPRDRRRDKANGQSATIGIEIGFVRRYPEIDADGGIVGMGIDRGVGLKTLKGPGLRERVLSQ